MSTDTPNLGNTLTDSRGDTTPNVRGILGGGVQTPETAGTVIQYVTLHRQAVLLL